MRGAPRVWNRPDATTAADVAAGWTAPGRRLDDRAAMTAETLSGDFLRYVCQTSPTPLGIVVARASGSSIWDANGREYLDLLSGMGVANVGHSHPAVLAAVAAQAAKHLHVTVYGEAVQHPQVALAR